MLLFRLLLKAAPLLLFFLFSRLLREMLRGEPGASRGGNRGSSSRTGGGARYTPPPSGKRDPYAVLGCSPSSSDDEVKKCYRELLGRYHPDKFIGQKLDDDFVALASKKFQEIQEAYSRIRAARGF